jgi:hypothetical protein
MATIRASASDGNAGACGCPETGSARLLPQQLASDEPVAHIGFQRSPGRGASRQRPMQFRIELGEGNIDLVDACNRGARGPRFLRMRPARTEARSGHIVSDYS